MTYCVGLFLRTGLAFASDSRTNAGVDYISSYTKMHIFQPAEDRVFVLMAAGNLATSQAVLHQIKQDIDEAMALPDRSKKKGHIRNLLEAEYIHQVADYIGGLSIAIQEKNEPILQQYGASGQASFILGGQIAGQPHGMFLIYPQGNSICATSETPYLQIGESKYGKPPLDYISHYDMGLEKAGRLLLVSQIVTHRSNLTCGPPFDIAIVQKNEFRICRRLKLKKDSPELWSTRKAWADVMTQSIEMIPQLQWEDSPV